MIADALASLGQVFSPALRPVMWRTLALTTAILAAAGIALDRLALSLIHAGPAWLGALVAIAVALGLIVGMIFLAAPVAALVASFFLDEVAAIVEREIDPDALPGRPPPLPQAVAVGLRFTLLSIAVNIVALALTLLTGVGALSFLLLNGYLFGREYFELAAMRHLPSPEAREMRQRNRGEVYLAGLVVSAFVAVPVLNLLTPLFATVLMTRSYKRLARRPAGASQASD